LIVIYGTRFYGEVDSHGGHRQLTKFFHVYYVPLVPVSTLWVTGDVDNGYSGHPVRMSGRSVVAGYARVWAPLAAFGAFVAGSAGSMVAAAALVALCAWTWTWRSVRGAREQRRSDFHLLAFGTRCDPLNMEHELATSLQPYVARRWAEVAEGNSPEDIARLGAGNSSQAVLAYASLRLAARLAPGEQVRKQSLDNSERIIDAIKETPVLEGGPYRATPQPALPDPTGIHDGPGAGIGR
jgi:hypothetical protein